MILIIYRFIQERNNSLKPLSKLRKNLMSQCHIVTFACLFLILVDSETHQIEMNRAHTYY